MYKNFLLSLSSIAIIGLSLSSCGEAAANDEQVLNADDITGRWNLTLDSEGGKRPSWLEIKKSGIKTLVGYYVGVNGSARPVSEIIIENGKFSFSIPPQWEEGNHLKLVGSYANNTISGTVTFPDGSEHPFTGDRAPALRKSQEVEWGEVTELFNGTDFSNWTATGENQWKIENGVLINPKAGANIYTNEKFDDFKLHLEFRYPEGSNGGVYLRGRYEVQILDSKGKEPSNIEFGGVYGFISPSEMVAKSAGEWQNYEITLTGRMVSIIANGKKIICNQEIPGITGGALDSNEGEPGPILLQGDHGPVEFRRIAIQKAVVK